MSRNSNARSLQDYNYKRRKRRNQYLINRQNAAIAKTQQTQLFQRYVGQAEGRTETTAYGYSNKINNKKHTLIKKPQQSVNVKRSRKQYHQQQQQQISRKQFMNKNQNQMQPKKEFMMRGGQKYKPRMRSYDQNLANQKVMHERKINVRNKMNIFQNGHRQRYIEMKRNNRQKQNSNSMDNILIKKYPPPSPQQQRKQQIKLQNIYKNFVIQPTLGHHFNNKNYQGNPNSPLVRNQHKLYIPVSQTPQPQFTNQQILQQVNLRDYNSTVYDSENDEQFIQIPNNPQFQFVNGNTSPEILSSQNLHHLPQLQKNKQAKSHKVLQTKPHYYKKKARKGASKRRLGQQNKLSKSQVQKNRKKYIKSQINLSAKKSDGEEESPPENSFIQSPLQKQQIQQQKNRKLKQKRMNFGQQGKSIIGTNKYPKKKLKLNFL